MISPIRNLISAAIERALRPKMSYCMRCGVVIWDKSIHDEFHHPITHLKKGKEPKNA